MEIKEDSTVQQKINHLLENYRYVDALSLLHLNDKVHGQKNRSLFENEVKEIIRQHADHLFLNERYEDAIQKYLSNPLDTGVLLVNPSVVIEKFLSKNLITQLADFLFVLHVRKHFNSNHTRLLLHCYVQDILFSNNNSRYKELEKFVMMSREYGCDSSNIIEVLKRYGFYVLALKVSYKYRLLNYVVRIEVECFGKGGCVRTIGVLERMKITSVEETLEDYLGRLMEYVPLKVCNFLVRYCCDYEGGKIVNREMVKVEAEVNKSFSFFNFSKKKKKVFVFEGESDPEYLRKLPETIRKRVKLMKKYNPEKLIKYFCAAKRNDLLLVFLESVVCRISELRRKKLSSKIFNTLLELYLLKLKDNKNNQFVINEIYENITPIKYDNLDDEEGLTEKQLYLNKKVKDTDYSIESPLPLNVTLIERIKILLGVDTGQTFVDLQHALVLILLYECENEEIIEFLYNELDLKYDILNYYKKKENYEKVSETCKKFGKKEPTMYIQTLHYFVDKAVAKNKNGDIENVNRNLEKILEYLKKNDIVTPLRVINILSKNDKSNVIKISLVKSYLKKKISYLEDSLKDYNNRILTLKNQSNIVKQKIEDQRTKGTVVKLGKCDKCSGKLKFPIFHFMCGHMFHRSCLNKAGRCPHCESDAKKTVNRFEKMKGMNKEKSSKSEKKIKRVNKNYNNLGLFNDLDII